MENDTEISWKDKKTNEEILHIVQEDKDFKHNMVSQAQVDGSCVMYDGILHDILEGRMLGKSTRGRRRIQLVGDLLETKNYADLKKAAEDMHVQSTIKRLS